MSSYGDILRQAADIADVREPDYGDVIENLRDTQMIAKAMFDLEISQEGIAKLLIALKVSRQKHWHKDDNILDTINYNAILLHVLRGGKRTARKGKRQ